MVNPITVRRRKDFYVSQYDPHLTVAGDVLVIVGVFLTRNY